MLQNSVRIRISIIIFCVQFKSESNDLVTLVACVGCYPKMVKRSEAIKIYRSLDKKSTLPRKVHPFASFKVDITFQKKRSPEGKQNRAQGSE